MPKKKPKKMLRYDLTFSLITVMNCQAPFNTFFFLFEQAVKIEKARERYFEYEAKQADAYESRVP